MIWDFNAVGEFLVNKGKPAIKEYLKLFRVDHYIKNILIFIPLFFSLSFYKIHSVITCIAGFCVFSLLSSAVYMINDIKDREDDKNHSRKRERPLAAGTVSTEAAVKSIFIFLTTAACLVYAMRLSGGVIYAAGVLTAYLALNIAYSFGAKNIPIIDVIILASGYVLRVVFGGLIINVTISFWLYLVITLCAFYLGFGKRRNEIAQGETNARKVLQEYTYNFLDKNMYVCQTLCVVFYSLWSVDSGTIRRLRTSAFVYTVPLVFLIFLKYSMNIEQGSDGDPVPVLWKDKALFALIVLYAIISAAIVCLGGKYGA
jgi:4-hydroxybenzoate polyprenyltransferase